MVCLAGVVSRVRRIVEFIERQYVTGQGDVRENVEALFCEDVEYHTDAETLTRDDLVAMGRAVRDSPRVGRTLEASRFREEGDAVYWHLSAVLPGFGEDGADVTQESDLVARFANDGRIREVWSSHSA